MSRRGRYGQASFTNSKSDNVISEAGVATFSMIPIEIESPTEAPVEPEVPAGENLLKNGDFSNGETDWTKAVTSPGEATITFAQNKVVINITNVGDQDWSVQLKQVLPALLVQQAPLFFQERCYQYRYDVSE